MFDLKLKHVIIAEMHQVHLLVPIPVLITGDSLITDSFTRLLPGSVASRLDELDNQLRETVCPKSLGKTSGHTISMH